MSEFVTAASTADETDDAVTECLDTLDGLVDLPTSDFVWLGVSPEHSYEAVVEQFRDATNDAPLIGASSAGEFTEDGTVSGGISAAVVRSETLEFSAGLGTSYSEDVAESVAQAIDELDTSIVDEYPYAAGINHHDGLAGRGDEVTIRAYQALDIPFAGGSAGDDRRIEQTAVFANDSVSTDGVALAVIGSEKPLTQSTANGHRRVSEGMRVTESDGSVVTELDGQSAYGQWANAVRDAVSQGAGLELDSVEAGSDEWVSLLTRYEFGIETGGETFKIRWPGLTPDKSGPLHFATEIPEGTELFLMDAQPDAERDAQQRVAATVGDDIAGALSFACICQADIQGDGFNDAVRAVADRVDAPIAGMEVYGEVGLNEDDMRGYHNASLSMLGFPA